MRSSLMLWILAILLTLFSASWQRRTGPTHPLSGHAHVAGQDVAWTFERTHKGAGGQRVELTVPPAVTGTMEWRRHGAGMEWAQIPMQRAGDRLVAELPWQPPAGVLKYRVVLEANGESVAIPEREDVTIRYTGPVPAGILVPHILLMITAMLMSTRAGLECFARQPRLRAYSRWALGVLFVGGMIFGPLVLKHAFGIWWSGWPLGGDITDNKTLIALVGWIVATLVAHRARAAKPWVFAASVLMFLVFMIPHSYRGTGFEPAPPPPGSGVLVR